MASITARLLVWRNANFFRLDPSQEDKLQKNIHQRILARYQQLATVAFAAAFAALGVLLGSYGDLSAMAQTTRENVEAVPEPTEPEGLDSVVITTIAALVTYPLQSFTGRLLLILVQAGMVAFLYSYLVRHPVVCG